MLGRGLLLHIWTRLGSLGVMDMHNCFHLLEQIQVTQKESHLFLGVHDTEDIVDCLEAIQNSLIMDLATFGRSRLLQDSTQ